MGTFLFHVFPDGRLPSRRWRPLAYLSAAALLLTVASDLFLTGNMADSVVPASGNPFAPGALDGIPSAAAVSLPLLLIEWSLDEPAGCVGSGQPVELRKHLHSPKSTRGATQRRGSR
jgi:hypothetical protein